MEAQAILLVARIWSAAADTMAAVWPILAFPVALAAVFAVGSWVRGLMS